MKNFSDEIQDYVISKNYVINTEDNSFCIQLLVSDTKPPKTLYPDEYDFLVHVKSDLTELDDDILEILERAAIIMNRKGERNPDSDSDTYKVRVDTSRVMEDTNVYIRDEKKDVFSFMAISGLLYRLIKAIIKDIDEMEGVHQADDDDQDGDYKTSDEYDDNLPTIDDEENK